MPTYEFRCRDCAQSFDVQRPMSASSEPAPCPDGHTNTVRRVSSISISGGLTATGGGGGGGGCCGGSCGCAN
ncbi:MAG TPA: zinc ribbon domain-containing protein [Actinophytocola sp.]|nr:zinc ribbon domain-containing protein [Actinophytocola sp.]